jgi:hypothetical protein
MQGNPGRSDYQKRERRGMWVVTGLVATLLLIIIVIFLLAPQNKVGPVTPTNRTTGPVPR